MQILELLANRPSHATLSEISQELGIPVSSLHGLLKTMKRRMWLEVDETNTRFGWGSRLSLVGSSLHPKRRARGSGRAHARLAQ